MSAPARGNDEKPAAEVIDAHHHLWRYTPQEYGWIDETMQPLQRDFLPQDLRLEMAAAGVAGTVAVQARQTLEETRWLCELADANQEIRGVVGWAPIASGQIAVALEEICTLTALKGLRHVVQAEPSGFLDDPSFNEGMRRVTDAGLTYDVLIFERQMEEATRFIDRHPRQPFVVDHIAKPSIAAGEIEPWRTHLRELARRPNVMCKLSGMVTEADWRTWNEDDLRPFLDACVESFGPARLMAGSDWPVCLVASSYSRWWKVLRRYFCDFSRDEQDAVFGRTACAFYGLGCE